jgi:hypothetical protein
MVSGVDDYTRKQMLGAIAAGRLTVVEVAEYLDVHRMQVWRWVKAAKIDPKAARVAYIASVVRATVIAKPPSKRILRERARRAKEVWEKRAKIKSD